MLITPVVEYELEQEDLFSLRRIQLVVTIYTFYLYMKNLLRKNDQEAKSNTKTLYMENRTV